MRTLVLLLVLVAACGSAASSMAVKTTGAEVSTMAQHHTYSYAIAREAPQGYARGDLDPELLQAIQREVDAALKAKGYQRVEVGDLLVRISTGERTVEDAPTGLSAAIGAPSDFDTEGALVVDVLDPTTGELLFHGFARDVLRGDDMTAEQIERAVERILEPVPAAAQR